MRKKIVMFTSMALMCAVMTACGNSKSQKQSDSELQKTTVQNESLSNTNENNISKTQMQTTAKVVNGVKILSLYKYNEVTGNREKTTGSFESTWVQGQDIVSFEAYATDVDKFSLSGSNFKKEWEKYWNTFENNSSCKIGYIVEFNLKNGDVIKKTITGPNDVFSYRNYLECYLYDDVNQIQGNWYSHLLDSEVTDATVMTSIKFTAGTDISQVGDTIKLTAFVYNSMDDFDASGNYIGTVKDIVEVKNR